MRHPLRFSLNFPNAISTIRFTQHYFFRLPAPATFTTASGATSSGLKVEGGDSEVLYRRISPIGNPNVSIVPVLDEWVSQGREVSSSELRSIIKELSQYRRYNHALQVSQWMTDERYIPPLRGDVAARLKLIFKVHGIEKAEDYFHNVASHLKGPYIYISLLNCYCDEKLLDKAEATMEDIRDMGFKKRTIACNILMNLYYQLGLWEKMDALLCEMEERDIHFDQCTYTSLLSAYAAASDHRGVHKIVNRMDSDLNISPDWHAYAVAASGYLKLKLPDNAMVMLNRIEKLIPSAKAKDRNFAFNFLLKQYAAMGKKDDLFRIWKLYKAKERVHNKGYTSMISGLLVLNDIETAEEVLEEWKSCTLCYDFQVPNLLLVAYCKQGLVEKAEALLEMEADNNSSEDLTATWCALAGAYIVCNQVPKAMDAIRKAVSMCKAGERPGKETMTKCLKYLEGKGDVKDAEEFAGILVSKGVFSKAAQERLLAYGREQNLLS